jgi:hypothetical protein
VTEPGGILHWLHFQVGDQQESEQGERKSGFCWEQSVEIAGDGNVRDWKLLSEIATKAVSKARLASPLRRARCNGGTETRFDTDIGT